MTALNVKTMLALLSTPSTPRKRPRYHLILTLGFIVASVCLGSAAIAQPVITPGIAVHRYHEVGEPVMAIDVWGSIRLTGRFFLPTETGLLELLALTDISIDIFKQAVDLRRPAAPAQRRV